MKKLRALLRSFLRYFNYHILWRFIFFTSSILPVDKKLVVFADSQSTKLTDNMQVIYDELKSRGGYKFVFCLAPELTGKKLTDLFAVYGGFMRFSYYYSHCGTLILTDSYLPAFACKPRKDTTVIQLWHACGAFKKWGYSTASNGWGADEKSLRRYPLHNCYSNVCVSSEFVIPYYAEAFNCDSGIIKPAGVPRTDIFFDDNFVKNARQEVIKRLPQTGSRKIILYAPTFRGNDIKSAHTDRVLDFAKLRDALGDRFVIINKLHPFVKTPLNVDGCEDFAFSAPGDLDISVLLCAADMVISDYSSLIFEYSLLSRPMIFFAYDLAEYEEQRSFYFPYSEVPGDIVSDTDGVINAVNRAETDFDEKRVSDFKEKFMSACDGKSTERVMEWIK